MIKSLAATFIVSGLIAGAAALAGPVGADQAAQMGGSGLPVPRFVSLGSSEVNMRTGPGENYPILWIYKREGLPVKVTQEYGLWRKVEDMDGASGWIKSSGLSEVRTAYVTERIRTLYATPDVKAKPLWRLAPGVVARVVLCEEAWCQLNVNGRTGWLMREQFWGALPGENFN